ncbi:hypothetical protein CBR_g48188 [Chara braunii]|uniref:EF-hand domain-containing protein n=1 Tax=Chara braunii TaxID=69332 RepID=A0A388M256_CHABU|nr:hypothetical protein CBR_g48188 [Chara braunii]|eukprot:GBG88657.1 hypothetical protein CBR_g48188 [Chara braunii]
MEPPASSRSGVQAVKTPPLQARPWTAPVQSNRESFDQTLWHHHHHHHHHHHQQQQQHTPLWGELQLCGGVTSTSSKQRLEARSKSGLAVAAWASRNFPTRTSVDTLFREASRTVVRLTKEYDQLYQRSRKMQRQLDDLLETKRQLKAVGRSLKDLPKKLDKIRQKAVETKANLLSEQLRTKRYEHMADTCKHNVIRLQNVVGSLRRKLFIAQKARDIIIWRAMSARESQTEALQELDFRRVEFAGLQDGWNCELEGLRAESRQQQAVAKEYFERESKRRLIPFLLGRTFTFNEEKDNKSEAGDERRDSTATEQDYLWMLGESDADRARRRALISMLQSHLSQDDESGRLVEFFKEREETHLELVAAVKEADARLQELKGQYEGKLKLYQDMKYTMPRGGSLNVTDINQRLALAEARAGHLRERCRTSSELIKVMFNGVTQLHDRCPDIRTVMEAVIEGDMMADSNGGDPTKPHRGSRVGPAELTVWTGGKRKRSVGSDRRGSKGIGRRISQPAADGSAEDPTDPSSAMRVGWSARGGLSKESTTDEQRRVSRAGGEGGREGASRRRSWGGGRQGQDKAGGGRPLRQGVGGEGSSEPSTAQAGITRVAEASGAASGGGGGGGGEGGGGGAALRRTSSARLMGNNGGDPSVPHPSKPPLSVKSAWGDQAAREQGDRGGGGSGALSMYGEGSGGGGGLSSPSREETLRRNSNKTKREASLILDSALILGKLAAGPSATGPTRGWLQPTLPLDTFVTLTYSQKQMVIRAYLRKLENRLQPWVMWERRFLRSNGFTPLMGADPQQEDRYLSMLTDDVVSVLSSNGRRRAGSMSRIERGEQWRARVKEEAEEAEEGEGEGEGEAHEQDIVEEEDGAAADDKLVSTVTRPRPLRRRGTSLSLSPSTSRRQSSSAEASTAAAAGATTAEASAEAPSSLLRKDVQTKRPRRASEGKLRRRRSEQPLSKKLGDAYEAGRGEEKTSKGEIMAAVSHGTEKREEKTAPSRRKASARVQSLRRRARASSFSERSSLSMSSTSPTWRQPGKRRSRVSFGGGGDHLRSYGCDPPGAAAAAGGGGGGGGGAVQGFTSTVPVALRDMHYRLQVNKRVKAMQEIRNRVVARIADFHLDRKLQWSSNVRLDLRRAGDTAADRIEGTVQMFQEKNDRIREKMGQWERQAGLSCTFIREPQFMQLCEFLGIRHSADELAVIFAKFDVHNKGSIDLVNLPESSDDEDDGFFRPTAGKGKERGKIWTRQELKARAMRLIKLRSTRGARDKLGSDREEDDGIEKLTRSWSIKMRKRYSIIDDVGPSSPSQLGSGPYSARLITPRSPLKGRRYWDENMSQFLVRSPRALKKK